MRPVNLLATGRRTFVQEAGNSVNRRARRLLETLGAAIQGPAELIEFAADATFERAPDGVDILLCATFADASVAEAAFGSVPGPVVLWAVRDPAPEGDRMYLNSLCGANLAAHALVGRGVRVRLIYGDPEEQSVRDALSELLDPGPDPVLTALGGLRGKAIGVVGDAPAGFTSCEYDAGWLQETLGLRVTTMTLESAFARIGAVPVEQRQCAAAATAERSPSLRHIPEPEVLLHGATTSALMAWADAERLSALALRCWPEFPLQLGGCPCSALGRLASSGIATACEADVNGAATMLLMQALAPAAGPTYLADVVRIDEAANTATFWHCGLAPVELAAEPEHPLQDLHCNRGLGVAGNFALKPGRVTIARISHSRDGYRLLLSGGEALPGPNRFKGNSVDVRLDTEAAGFIRTVVERGFEHHTVLAWAELRPELRRAAQHLGLQLVEC